MTANASESGSKLPHSKSEAFATRWAHSPCHVFVPGTAYFITAGTYRKNRLLNTPSGSRW